MAIVGGSWPARSRVTEAASSPDPDTRDPGLQMDAAALPAVPGVQARAGGSGEALQRHGQHLHQEPAERAEGDHQ